MIAKDGQPAEPDSQSNYEAAVLDFLDKEMADVQATPTDKKQSEELDALFADLLHQVIVESDDVKSGDGIVASEDMKALLAEFETSQETVPEEAGTSPAPAPVKEKINSSEHVNASPQSDLELQMDQEADPMAFPKISAAMFTSPAAQKNKMPLIAAAVVCVLALIGYGVYRVSHSSHKAPTPQVAQSVAPVVAAPVVESPAAQSSVQPKATAKAPRVVPPVADKKPAADDSRAAAPVPVTQKPVVSQTATPPATGANKALPTPAREEKPAEPQVAPSVPPVVPQAAPEKPAPQPVVTENPAPANPVAEKKPLQQPPVVTANVETAAPAPTPQVPASIAPKNLLPAVAISQVSPKFPEFAVRTRSSGAVDLMVNIDKQGKVVKATPVSGPEMFYKEAINAAMQWRYKPATIDGVNVPSQVKVTFTFNLKK